MHIKPYLGNRIGSGKSGFAVNRGAVKRGFTVLNSLFNVLRIAPNVLNCLVKKYK